MANRLSPEQYQVIREAVTKYGTLAMAASIAGVSLNYLKRVLVDDEDFAQEINEALEVHSAGIYTLALQRAEKSDTILGKLLEAKVDGFSTESRKQALAANGRITKLTLRTFDDDGNEAGVTDVAPKQQPGEPLKLALDSNRL